MPDNSWERENARVRMKRLNARDATLGRSSMASVRPKKKRKKRKIIHVAAPAFQIKCPNPNCTAKVNPSNLKRHLRRIHGIDDPVAHPPSPALTHAAPNHIAEQTVTCPRCPAKVKPSRLARHMTKAHGTMAVGPRLLPENPASPISSKGTKMAHAGLHDHSDKGAQALHRELCTEEARLVSMGWPNGRCRLCGGHFKHIRPGAHLRGSSGSGKMAICVICLRRLPPELKRLYKIEATAIPRVVVKRVVTVAEQPKAVQATRGRVLPATGGVRGTGKSGFHHR